MQVESKRLTKRFLIFISVLLINTVFPLISVPSVYLMSKLYGAAPITGRCLKEAGANYEKEELFI